MGASAEAAASLARITSLAGRWEDARAWEGHVKWLRQQEWADSSSPGVPFLARRDAAAVAATSGNAPDSAPAEVSSSPSAALRAARGSGADVGSGPAGGTACPPVDQAVENLRAQNAAAAQSLAVQLQSLAAAQAHTQELVAQRRAQDIVLASAPMAAT
eukprot:11156738-Lingulodinium_polyedra.AAC.1